MSHLSSYTLDLYLDDELPAAERSAVEAHLEGCAECRSRADGLREFFVALDTVQPEGIPVDLAPRVLARLAPRTRPLQPLVAGAAILAVQAGVAAWVLLWLGSGPGDWVAQALSIVPASQSQSYPAQIFVLPSLVRDPSPDSLLTGTQAWLGNLANGGAILFEHIDPVQWWAALVVAAILWVAGNRLLMAPTGRKNGKREEAAR